MLQILLAFLAISIVSVTGYGLMEQLSLQQIMMDQRENARRLDVAADAVAGRLISVAGEPGVFAPAPSLASTGWSALPTELGGIKATVDGIPFLYCPIAPRTPAAGSGSVKSPDGSSYGIEVKGGAVVGSELGNSIALSGVLGSAYHPLALIIAAGRGVQTPPKCTDVQERNGRPFVTGGLVKVVSRPGDVQGQGTIAASSSEIYVSPSGGGNGTQSDPASIDDALKQWVNNHPSSMTIHVIGNVTVQNAGVWSAFAGSFSNSASRLTIDGADASITAPAGPLGVSANFSMSGGTGGLTLLGPTLVVNQGDEFSTQGSVVLSAVSASGTGESGLYVQQGGRLNVSNGVLRVAGANSGVESSGDVAITSGTIFGSGAWSLALTNGGRLLASSASIGDPSGRNGTAGLAVAGAWSVSSDAASRVIAGGSGTCWSTLDASDTTFSYSANGAGARSPVLADPSPPAMTDANDPAQVEAYQAYRRDVDARQRARQTNHSNFQCI